MTRPMRKTLIGLLLFYAAASLVHFIHNAEFIADYPGLPVSWSRAGVYSAWVLITTIGVGGWFLMVRGSPRAGLVLLAVYAVCGLDSLGHYVVAPMSAHTLAMNATILLEVTAALLVLAEITRQMAQRTLQGRRLEDDA